MSDNATVYRYSASSEKTPYFTIFTPAYKRPMALARNRASLAAQKCQDYEQIIMVDEVGRGFGWLARQFETFAPMAHGRYVLSLADDDELADSSSLADIRSAVELLDYDPEVIVTRFGLIWSSGHNVVIPEPEFWAREAVFQGHISGQNLIVRNDIYQKHAHDWRYEGDGYEFEIAHIQAILDPANGYRALWLPFMPARMQFRGLGRTEEELKGAIHV